LAITAALGSAGADEAALLDDGLEVAVGGTAVGTGVGAGADEVALLDDGLGAAVGGAAVGTGVGAGAHAATTASTSTSARSIKTRFFILLLLRVIHRFERDTNN